MMQDPNNAATANAIAGLQGLGNAIQSHLSYVQGLKQKAAERDIAQQQAVGLKYGNAMMRARLAAYGIDPDGGTHSSSTGSGIGPISPRPGVNPFPGISQGAPSGGEIQDEPPAAPIGFTPAPSVTSPLPGSSSESKMEYTDPITGLKSTEETKPTLAAPVVDPQGQATGQSLVGTSLIKSENVLTPDQIKSTQDWNRQSQNYDDALSQAQGILSRSTTVGAGPTGGGAAGRFVAGVKSWLGSGGAAADLDTLQNLRNQSADIHSAFASTGRPPGEAQAEVHIKAIPELDQEPEVWKTWIAREKALNSARRDQNDLRLKAAQGGVPTVPYRSPGALPEVNPRPSVSGLTPSQSRMPGSGRRNEDSVTAGSSGNERASYGALPQFTSMAAAKNAKMPPGTKYQVLGKGKFIVQPEGSQGQ